ncbi:unnamed protein product [Symbiodinium sp. CCMP2456]|nr:unnamed protein product [Symbiodinium sp. CCMP2456]
MLSPRHKRLPMATERKHVQTDTMNCPAGMQCSVTAAMLWLRVLHSLVLAPLVTVKGVWILLLPLVDAVRAAREGRADVGLLELDHHHAEEEMHTNLQQQTHLTSLEHVANSAAAGELLIFRMLTGQPKQDLWTNGLAGYNVSRTLDAYHINSAGKLHEAVAAAADTRCMGRLLLDSEHRCHKAFPVYDLMLTTCSSLLALVYATLVASAEEKLVGEFGQEVLGCRCAGGKTTHGNCGYHFHFMSNEDKPWCRTKFGCGHYSIKGNWVYCDPRGTERRRADDGKLYNALDFKKFYPKDGKEKWAAAAAYEETRIARNGKAYKASEFRDYYIDYLGEDLASCAGQVSGVVSNHCLLAGRRAG